MIFIKNKKKTNRICVKATSKFKKWDELYRVLIDNQLAEFDQLLLIWYASIQIPHKITADEDSHRQPWNSTVIMQTPLYGYYISNNKRKTITIIHNNNGHILPKELTVMSLNLGLNIQLNNRSGSEQPMVERCQNAFGNSIECTRLTAKTFLYHQADIICLQEAYFDGVNIIVKDLNQMCHSSQQYTFVIDRNAAIIYRKKLNAIPVINTHRPYNENGIRDFVAIMINDIIFLSLWLGHFDTKTKYKNVFQECTDRLVHASPKRIVIGMDSNDHNNTLFKMVTKQKSLAKICNLRLYLPAHKPLKTCCEDVNYNFNGDYIMDSNCSHDSNYTYEISTLYGKTKKNNNIQIVKSAKQQLFSDHLPILYKMII